MWIHTLDNALVNADKVKEIYISKGKDGLTAVECEYERHFDEDEVWRILGDYPTEKAAKYALQELANAMDDWQTGKLEGEVIPMLTPKECEDKEPLTEEDCDAFTAAIRKTVRDFGAKIFFAKSRLVLFEDSDGKRHDLSAGDENEKLVHICAAIAIMAEKTGKTSAEICDRIKKLLTQAEKEVDEEEAEEIAKQAQEAAENGEAQIVSAEELAEFKKWRKKKAEYEAWIKEYLSARSKTDDDA